MKFIAYYTPLYAEVADRLRQSAQDIDLILEEVPDMGGWNQNTHYKPTFIKQKLEELKQPVVYIDADSVIEKNPTPYFLSLDCDVAFHRLTKAASRNNELLSGVVYFDYNPIVFDLLDKWIEKCSDDLHVWDQYSLDECIKETNEISVTIMPVGYCAIFDHPSVQGEDIFIKQMQASRQLKRS